MVALRRTALAVIRQLNARKTVKPKDRPTVADVKWLNVRTAFELCEGRGDIEGVLDRILILIAESCEGKWDCRQTSYGPRNATIEWALFRFPNGDGDGYERVKNFEERIDKVIKALSRWYAFEISNTLGKKRDIMRPSSGTPRSGKVKLDDPKDLPKGKLVHITEGEGTG